VSTKTVWEQGHEPGRQVVVLGLAVALTAVALDVLLFEAVGLLFDLVFVALSVALALLVRPRDFFTVGVLPPLLMVAMFLLVGATRPGAVAHPEDGVVQAVISGLSAHSVALVVGYALCLGSLAVRQRFLQRGRVGRAGRAPRGPVVTPRSGPGRLHPDG
jgi:hypothetical protein